MVLNDDVADSIDGLRDEGGMIEKKDILKIIPYGESFLMIDKVTYLDKNRIIVTKVVSDEESWVKSHMVDFPILPGVLITEGLAQAGTILVRYNLAKHYENDVLLYQVNETKYFCPVFPGQKISIEVKFCKKERNKVFLKGKAYSNLGTCSESEIVLAIVEKSKFREKYESKENKKVFVFDMDGVIVDTVESHFNSYRNFIRSFGIEWDQNDCDLLNGQKLDKIIGYAKVKYGLPGTVNELLDKYNLIINNIYLNAPLMGEVEKILKILKREGVKIALASSASAKNVATVLTRFNLRHYFDFVVSGDEVNQGKHSAEIFNLVQNRFKNHEFYVIEDSEQGVMSAIASNSNVIFFNSQKKAPITGIDYDISRIEEIENILAEIKINCKTISISSDIKVEINDTILSLTDEQEDKVNKIWMREKEINNSLFNGKIVSHESHFFAESGLVIKGFVVEYKYFLAQLKDPTLNFNIKPLAVSGVIFDKNQNVLVAKRQNVAEYNQHYEFVPSGGLNPSHISEKEILFIDQLKEEFVEETKLKLETIEKITPFCMVVDKQHQVYDLCCKVQLNVTLPENFKTGPEYCDSRLISFRELASFIRANNFVPTSKMLAEIMKKESEI